MSLPRPIDDCRDVQLLIPDADSTVYPFLVISLRRYYKAYCDMETENGGWTVSVCLCLV